MKRPINKADGVWPFDRPADVGARAITPAEFAAQMQDKAFAVLSAAGFTLEELMTKDGYAAAERSVQLGSREAVALSLWGMAKNGIQFLYALKDDERRWPGLEDAVAGTFANIGLMSAMLDADLTRAARTGGAVLAAEGSRRAARGAQANRDRLDQWGNKALRIAREAQADTAERLSRAALVRVIRGHPEAGQKGLLLPVSDRAIEDFLRSEGL